MAIDDAHEYVVHLHQDLFYDVRVRVSSSLSEEQRLDEAWEMAMNLVTSHPTIPDNIYLDYKSSGTIELSAADWQAIEYVNQ